MRGKMTSRAAVAACMLIFAIAPAAFAQPQSAQENLVHVDIIGLHNNTGQMLCALFSSADGFPTKPEKALASAASAISSQAAVCEFRGVAAGTYAISAVHDENSNGKLDRNFIGIPREGVGASNDAKGSFGPPRFDAAAFRYQGGRLDLKITVNYL